MERCLFPDAPVRNKRSRKQSPNRSPCRLEPGTPVTPPSPILQAWEIKREKRTPPRADLEEAEPGQKQNRPKTNIICGSENVATAKPRPSNNAATAEPEDSDDEADDLEISEVEYEREQIKKEECFDYACLAPADPDLHDPLQVEWLAHNDMDSDRLLHDLMGSSSENLKFDWSHDPESFTGQRLKFTGTHGPTFEVDDKARPIDIFLKFFDNDLMDLIVRQTNKHATYMIDRDLPAQSRLHFWTNVDRDEMFIFFAILILQGNAPFTVEKDFWQENGYLTLKYFKTLMSYNRFTLIKRLLHFSDNRTNTTTDRLGKIKPVLDHLNEKFSSLYFPGRDIAINESLLKWNGRLSFTQKIATKAAPVGVKTYELCESSTGYLWKFFVYTDQKHECIEETEQTRKTSVPPPTNATAHIVYELVRPLLNRGHTLLMDNFYNSPLLARYLKANGMDCYGTLRTNRAFVPEVIKSVTKADMRPGEIVQSYCRDMSVMIWRDTNVVSMISTFHKGTVGGKEKFGRYKYKPQVVLDYNMSMDKKDQLLSAHPMERLRNKVWYKKMFRHLLNVTIINAYVIFKSKFKNTSQRAFGTRLANELIQTFKFLRKVQMSYPLKRNLLFVNLVSDDRF